MPVVATAGHVDHGKSTLVEALTGTDPDRWVEEKARGLTIDLGFAFTTLPSGAALALVDVPGHVRFVRNMLAGVGSVDACLFVVSAVEGWKPQSEEHLRILELVGLSHGVVALTMVDRVDEDGRALARLEVAEAVAGSFLADAEVVEVAAPSGEGLDALRAALGRLVAGTPPAADHGRPRLWIDRAFPITGAGTVVTGTLTGGGLAVDDELVLLPQHRPVRVRGLQSVHAPVPSLDPGQRAACNLVGVSHDQVGRGDVLVRDGQWHETAMIDVALQVLAGLDHPVSRRGAYTAHIGAGEFPVRLRVLGSESLQPGAAGAVRLHLPVALPLLPGDHVVLREVGRQETVGGGEVLDVDPVLPAARARPDRSVGRVVAERGWVEADRLARLTGVVREPDVGRWVVDPPVLAEARDDLATRVATAGPAGLDLAGLDERDRAVLDLLDGVVLEGGRAIAAEARGDGPDLTAHPYLSALRADPWSPPPPEGVDRGELRELVRRGLVVQSEGIWFAADAVDAACERLAHRLAAQPDGLTVADVRDELGTSRKYALALLAHTDATGRTRRRGDLRIAGPRLLSD